MAITVNTQNVATPAPVAAQMQDASGADVELFLFVGDQAPIHQAFSVTTGAVHVPLSLPAGKHKCTLVVAAYWHKHNLNRAYDVELSINGALAASARGSIPAARTNDVGQGDFVITVI